MASLFKLTFLGTGGSWPTPGRSMPALVLQVDGTVNLIDCGEGTQKQLMKSRISFMDVDNVFISHFHGDHFIGLIGLVQSMSFNGRTKPLNIYCPEFGTRILSNALSVGYYTLNFDINVMEVDPGQIYDLGEFTVSAMKTDHPVPALAYRFSEKDLIRIDRSKVDSLGIPNRLIERIRQKGSVEHDGVTYTINQISGGVRKGRSLVYSGDTRPMPEEMPKFAENASVLIHETTTDSSLEPKVNEFGHTSSRQAAEIAAKSGAKRFFLFHYSPRVSDLQSLEKEARSIFHESYLSREMLEFSIPSEG
ncbi:MAG: ribonuclease Z [Candidatus Thermoplasmatota archaeon]|nr:ribonuclease Z [Candidatus Thermoplasmatota archaeon]